jgi:asparagine synthase (glutamine-hydrolysing)
MCGLAGILAPGWRADEVSGAVQTMTLTLAHRGPDDQGVWSDGAAGIGLGFRRLAIIDLSAEGHQPMSSASGRYVLVFNGEVYNYRELRPELEAVGHRFRGHSDTEVILASIEQWGVETALVRFVGMFAMAVWDRAERRLHLTRDRLGIKPMYVYRAGGVVAFASELKALATLPGFDRTVDPDALTAYLRYLYVPAPLTIYRNTRKLLPGHVLTIADPAQDAASVPFWSVEEAARRGIADRFDGDDREAVDELERLLMDATRLRLRADVPLGAFLSGGVDSSTTVALMQRLASAPVRTFTIGFDAREHDESAAAAAVASHLGTEHTEIRLTGEDARALIPRMPTVFDEPLADPSQLPTLLICEAARKGGLVVAVSGDGGDELFAGYNRYAYGERVLPRALRVPRAARRMVGAGLQKVPAASWDRVHRALTPALPNGFGEQRLVGDKMQKLGSLLPLPDYTGMYRSLLSAWQAPESLVAGGNGGADPVEAALAEHPDYSHLDLMLLADQRTYLADDLLAKVDRASMAVALEVRVPLLDHRVVEYSWRLPPRFKIRDGRGKWALRQVLYRHVPAELVDRPKVGFSVPLEQWLRGPLRGWAEDLLAPAALARDPLLRPDPIRAAWTAFQQGTGRAGHGLWAVLMYQAWKEAWN